MSLTPHCINHWPSISPHVAHVGQPDAAALSLYTFCFAKKRTQMQDSLFMKGNKTQVEIRRVFHENLSLFTQIRCSFFFPLFVSGSFVSCCDLYREHVKHGGREGVTL